MDDIAKSNLRLFLQNYAPVPEEQFKELCSQVKIRSYKAQERFVRIGEATHDVGLVLKGLFFSYYLTEDGKKIVRQFATERMPVAAYSRLLTNQPSNVDIEAIEDSVVIQVPYKMFVSFYDRHRAWETIGRKVAEAYYIMREHREHQLLTLDAEQRYLCFLEEFPNIVGRIQKSHLASYLGITAVSLSRILAKQKG